MQPHYTPSVQYFAGHFDGEGYISMQRRKQGIIPRIVIGVKCTYRPILDMYAERFGGFVHFSHPGVNKTLYSWHVKNFCEMLSFLQAVEPFLLEKQEQARCAINYLQQRLDCESHRNSLPEHIRALAFETQTLLHQHKL